MYELARRRWDSDKMEHVKPTYMHSISSIVCFIFCVGFVLNMWVGRPDLAPKLRIWVLCFKF